MIFNNLPQEQINLYKKYSQSIASLSGLSSESKIPFLYYRVVENIFCKLFGSKNLSRADISYGAKLNDTDIGLKIFIASNNTSREKIAEFNSHNKELQKLKNEKLVEKLSKLMLKFVKKGGGINDKSKQSTV